MCEFMKSAGGAALAAVLGVSCTTGSGFWAGNGLRL